ncbi:tetratricopeptide repeat protein [Kitasatospora sp. P5_F3]
MPGRDAQGPDTAEPAQARAEVARLRRSAAGAPEQADLGLALYRLAMLLGSTPGGLAEGAELMAEAVAVFRRLADRDQAGYRPALASALDMLALFVGLLGRRAEARVLATEAVALLREAARLEPELEPELAGALARLGNQLAETGAHQEALARIEEAVLLRRRLVASSRTSFAAFPSTASHGMDDARAELASALGDLGIKLAEMGRGEQAVPVLEESVGIYHLLGRRSQAPSDQAAYGATLFTLTGVLTELGRATEAAPYRAESAGLRDRLAATAPDLLASLDHLGQQHGFRLTHDGEFTRTSTPGPRIPAPDPTLLKRIGRLNSEGLALGRSGRAGAGAELLRDAVGLSAGHDHPGLHLVHANCLHSLGLLLAWDGRATEALSVTEQAVRIYRHQLPRFPGQVRHLYADALDSLGRRLAVLGRHREARAATEEAVVLYRQLVAAGAAGHTAGLATALNHLGIRYADTDDHTASLTVTSEAADLYRQLYAQDPEQHRSGAVHVLSNLALRHSRLEQTEQVLAPFREAVAILDSLGAHSPGSDVEQLAVSMEWLDHYLRHHGHRSEARVARRTADRLRRASR